MYFLPKCLPRIYKHQLYVQHNFVEKRDLDLLIRGVERVLKDLKFETGHFDHVISGYRETMKIMEPNEMQVLKKCIDFVELKTNLKFKWMVPHILELNCNGYILPHIDNIKASGRIILACCLHESPIVFKHKENPKLEFKIDCFPGSIYYQIDNFRNDFEHSIPNKSKINRMSIILRDKPTSL